MYIDADTHLDECEDTWAYMPAELRPTTITLEPSETPPWLHRGPGASSAHSRFWFMDGKLASRRIRDDSRSGTTEATRELKDVPARVADMDTLGVETQVVFPTVLLNEMTRRPELEVAMCASYNRWLYEKCDESSGRMRAIALVPFGSIPDALEELKIAKDRGAVGVLKRGVEWDRSAADPYFFPVYEKAADLDLPMCIHSSLPWAALDPHFSRFRPPYTLGFLGVTVLQAFHALAVDKIPAMFPKLRFGFIEAGSSWVPYMLDTIQYFDKRTEYLQANNMFVTCEAAEDLGYLFGHAGDDAFFIGTDYSHGDRASVMYAHKKIAERPDVSEPTAEKVTALNAKSFYHF